MHMIRKGQGRWLAKGAIAEQVRFINILSQPTNPPPSVRT